MSEIVWLIVAAVFLVAEIISLGLTSIWFAGGAFVAAIAAYFGANFWIQIAVFCVVSIVLLLGTRPFVKNHLLNRIEKTNVESYVGKTVEVISDIDNSKGKGQVRMNDLEWTARSASGEMIPAGTMVVIKEVSGVKLIVDVANS